MKIKNIGLSAVFLTLLLVISWLISPYWASYRIHSALKNNDASLLAKYVDFPAVKSHLKPQVQQQLQQRLKIKDANHIWGKLQQQGVVWLSDHVVDWVISPTGILLILQGKAGYESEIWQATQRYIEQLTRPVDSALDRVLQSTQKWLNGDNTVQNRRDEKPSLPPLQANSNQTQQIPKFQTHYGLQQFSLDVPYDAQHVKVYMQRQNNSWSWKITAIDLPKPNTY